MQISKRIRLEGKRRNIGTLKREENELLKSHFLVAACSLHLKSFARLEN
jgi:hypothetical protein